MNVEVTFFLSDFVRCATTLIHGCSPSFGSRAGGCFSHISWYADAILLMTCHSTTVTRKFKQLVTLSPIARPLVLVYKSGLVDSNSHPLQTWFSKWRASSRRAQNHSHGFDESNSPKLNEIACSSMNGCKRRARSARKVLWSSVFHGATLKASCPKHDRQEESGMRHTTACLNKLGLHFAKRFVGFHETCVSPFAFLLDIHRPSGPSRTALSQDKGRRRAE